ncbi:MAG: hypothetical protein C3F13_09575 [Anaerolineales bacterium]|nr:hypothetical protein [Anaerolineae bacterium]PWB53382.1 MAG: hypothetical protein C3F13_09575 [Anaerolineales bacterium]
MLDLLTILSEEMRNLSPSQKQVFISKLQDGHVPEYLVQLIRDAGGAARSYRPHSPGRRITNEKQKQNDEGAK